MKKLLNLLVVLLLIFNLPSFVHANENERKEFFITGEDPVLLTHFMNENNILVEKSYTSFPILRARLTDAQINKLKGIYPHIRIQNNSIYEPSKDTELESIVAVRATKQLTSPYSGAGVKVAVLDSGVDTEHRDLKVKGGYCSLKLECARGIPYDDDNGHGTHVAGIIAALHNDTGIAGIAPNVDLYSIKALNALGVGTTDSLIDGIEWAMKHNMDIINLSITTDRDDSALKTALDAAYKKGILIVGSAGNRGGATENTVMYPAKYDTVIGVAAVNPDLTKLEQSSVGKEIDIAAPGGNIFSTYPIEWDFTDGKADGYQHLSGTSMATPHVTGILALYKERFPKMTNAELRTLITSTAQDLGAPGKDPIFGHGLVQYVTNLPGTITFDQNSEAGKVTLTPKGTSSFTVEADGKRIQPIDGNWTVHGVKGTKSIFITTDVNGKKMTERQYVKFDNPSFVDVSNTQRFAGPIGFMSLNDQITGFKDGTFRPYTKITRGEAAALIGRVLGYSGEQTSTDFNDVPSTSFASGYINAAVEAKIISGFSDGTFRPGAYVTRAEMAILLSKTFKLKDTNTKGFKDVSKSMAAYQSIMALTAAGVTTGYGDNQFKPYDNMTRADFTVFLARAQDDAFK